MARRAARPAHGQLPRAAARGARAPRGPTCRTRRSTGCSAPRRQPPCRRTCGRRWPPSRRRSRRAWGAAWGRASRCRSSSWANASACRPSSGAPWSICLGPELDRRYDKLYAYLQDDITRKRPSADLVLDLLCDERTERWAARPLLTRQGRLLRLGVLEAGWRSGEPIRLERPGSLPEPRPARSRLRAGRAGHRTAPGRCPVRQPRRSVARARPTHTRGLVRARLARPPVRGPSLRSARSGAARAGADHLRRRSGWAWCASTCRRC